MTDCDPCAGLRAQIDILERRQEENEAEIALFGDRIDALSAAHAALESLNSTLRETNAMLAKGAEALREDLAREIKRAAKAEGELDAARGDLADAMQMLRQGFAMFRDLYKRVWIDGDDHDAQLDRMADWAGMTAEERGGDGE